MTTNGLLNATGGGVSITAGPARTGGINMGPNAETSILPVTGNIDIVVAIILPAADIGQRYHLTIGGGTYSVGVSSIVNNSGDGSDLLVSGSMGPANGGNLLVIGSSKNLTLNAAAGQIILGSGVTDAQSPVNADNDTGGPTDTGITESIPGSTVTIAGTHLVAISGQNYATGGLIMMPGANLYVNNWTGNISHAFGLGPITIMGNNTISKYLNGMLVGYNNRINLNGDLRSPAPNVPANTRSWGNENNYIVFVSTANAGTGEVHLGANVTINTITITDPYRTPSPDQTYWFGGLFDDGHGYGITKTGPGNVTLDGSSYFGDPESANFTGQLIVNGGTLELGAYGDRTPTGTPITNPNNVVSVDTAGTLSIANLQQTMAGLNDVATGGGTVTSDGYAINLYGRAPTVSAASLSASARFARMRSVPKTSPGRTRTPGPPRLTAAR